MYDMYTCMYMYVCMYLCYTMLLQTNITPGPRGAVGHVLAADGGATVGQQAVAVSPFPPKMGHNHFRLGAPPEAPHCPDI